MQPNHQLGPKRNAQMTPLLKQDFSASASQSCDMHLKNGHPLSTIYGGSWKQTRTTNDATAIYDTASANINMVEAAG